MRILFLDLDTLRPDHLGCYGYHRPTSPNLDWIAAQGVRFDQVYCADAPCLPSRAGLVTGRFGIHTGAVGHGGTAADLRLEGASRSFSDRLRDWGLFGTLRRAGLRTVSISPFAERHSFWPFYAGFNEMINTGQGGMESAESVTPYVLDWIQRNAASDNWFLHVNYWDAHTPYRAPEEFGNPFADMPIPCWITPELLESHRALTGPHGAREINMYDDHTWPRYPRHPGALHDMSDLRRMFDGYDCGIRYMDEHIGRVLQALDDQRVLDDLVIIVSADHGENMGELGIYGEHATADPATCRIPLLIRWPGMAEGIVDTGLHYQLDMAPTLAELLQVSPAPEWDGQRYAPSLRGEPCGRESLVVSQCAHVCQRGVRFGPWHYMRTIHDGYHLFDTEMLFHVETDPHEQHNLAGERPDICHQGAHRLLEWQEQQMRTSSSPIDPLWTVMREGGPFHTRGHLNAYLQRLEQTGRADGARALRERHPDEMT